jgi:hypothetical protein
MTALPVLLIVQPWFTTHGHLAQSTINTARVLHGWIDVSYVISQESGSKVFNEMSDRLRELAAVETFKVRSHSLRVSTISALWHLVKMAFRGVKFEYIFFLDADLVILASLWFLFARIISPKRILLRFLRGPERISKYFFIRKIVTRFLCRKDTKMFLGTNELRDAWHIYFADVPPDKIDVLPPLELSQSLSVPLPPVPCQRPRLGVIGQIRPGKGLEWLVPLFSEHSDLGVLTVVGSYFSQKHRDALRKLQNYPYFQERFLSEDEMIKIACQQDYLLMLYENWDDRMEGATLYLAARANRPVIAYEHGWCGRMIKTYSCGIIAPNSQNSMAAFFKSLPGSGTPGYHALLLGLANFRHAHSAENMRAIFIRQLLVTEERNVF